MICLNPTVQLGAVESDSSRDALAALAPKLAEGRCLLLEVQVTYLHQNFFVSLDRDLASAVANSSAIILRRRA